MKCSHIFEAEDGRTFDTAAECKAYEEREAILDVLICPWTREEIQIALDRTNLYIANAIERAGNIIAAKRRESGELRRKAKTDAEKFVDVGAAMKEKK